MPSSSIRLIQRTGNPDNEREQINAAIEQIKECLAELEDTSGITDTEPVTGLVQWGSLFGAIPDQADLQAELDLKADQADLDAHTSDTSNPHLVTKAQVGLGNVPDLDTTDAVNKAHDQNTDTALDTGGANEVTAVTITGHIGDADIHRTINDAGTAVTDLWSADKIGTELAGKSNTGHTHVEADITDLQAYLLSVDPADLNATNSPSDGQIPSFDLATGDFTWVTESGGGATELSDLTDVGVTTPTNRNALMADGDSWESRALVEADISDLQNYLLSESNDLTVAVTWADVPDANITQSSVLQHEAQFISQQLETFRKTYKPRRLIDANGFSDLISVTNSGGTRVNSKGLIEAVPDNTIRVNHDPQTGAYDKVLIEPAATNELVRSEPDAGVPTGTTTWQNTGSFTHVLDNYLGLNAVKHTQSTLGRSPLRLGVSLDTNTTYTASVWFDLNRSSVTSGNNFVMRSEFFGNPGILKSLSDADAEGRITITFDTGTDGVGDIFIGVGVGGDATGELVFTGWQLEKGTAATSLIITADAPATRAADDLIVDGTAFGQIWNPDEMTIVVEVDPLSAEDGTIISVNDGTANEAIILEVASGSYRVRVVDGGTAQASITGGAVTAGTKARLCLAYKQNDIAFYQDGVLQGTDTVATIPAVTQKEYGTGYGVIDDTYYPKRLSNEELELISVAGRDILGVENSQRLPTVETEPVTITRVKTADTTRSNTTTHTDDPHLVGLPVKAGRFYELQIGLIRFGDSDADLSVLLTGPAGMTSHATQTANTFDIFQSGMFVAVGGVEGKVDVTGVIFGATADGVVNLQWAQDTATPNDVTLLKGSWIKLTRLTQE